MSSVVKKSFRTGIIRLLCLSIVASPLIPVLVAEGGAASWQWSAQGTRERLIVDLDAPGQERAFSRTGTHALTLSLTAPPAGLVLSGDAPREHSLIAGAVAAGNAVEIRLRTPAVGYVVTRPDPRRLIVDVFRDPLGARWTPSGRLAPSESVAAAPRPVSPPEPVVNVKMPSPVSSSSPAPEFRSTSSEQALAPTSSVSPPTATPGMSAGQRDLPPSPKNFPELRRAVTPEIAASAKPDSNETVLPEMDATGALGAGMPETRPSGTSALLAAFSMDAFAADAFARGVPLGTRGIMYTPQDIRASANPGGAEGWPSSEALTTAIHQPETASSAAPGDLQTPSGSGNAPFPVEMPVSAAPVVPEPAVTPVALRKETAVSPPSSPVAGAAAVPESPGGENVTAEGITPGTMELMRAVAPVEEVPPPQTNATRPVIYVDEKGNPVPKPPEPDKMLAEAEKAMEETRYQDALKILEELKSLPVSPEMREKVLYLISDALAQIYAGKPLEGFESIVGATEEAMLANLRAPRVPDALLRLGMANVNVGNLSAAEGYFSALKRRYPDNINVPQAFSSLGYALLKEGRNAQAEKHFRSILQEYPEAAALRDAAVGLAKALHAQHNLSELPVILDFINKRWPRYYLEDPEFLLLEADFSEQRRDPETALQRYWLYYNLRPERPGNDGILAKMGDLYLRTGRPNPAMDLFEHVRKHYPGTDGAAVSLMRLAERGIHESPLTLEEMFAVFKNPGKPTPPLAYRELQDGPNPRYAVTAKLKLAMWSLWNKEYTDAMGAAADFIDAYPDDPDVEQARQVILRGFAAELKNSLAEENYGRVLILWNGFPLVREHYSPLNPDMRHALARGYLERGDDAKAFELMSEFLKTPKDERYGDEAFTLFFNKYLNTGNWNAVLDLGEKVAAWEMPRHMRSQLDYAMALSAENLALTARALPLWKALADRTDIPLYEQAYATYFLAKDAERRKDIKDAYALNKKTLELFTRLQEERSERADPHRIKEAINSLMDITEVANRIPEALEWVEKYNQFVPEASPEYAGLRFREARLYRKLGDTSKAQALLELIVKKEPDSPFGKAAASELRTFTVSRDLRSFMPGNGQ